MAASLQAATPDYFPIALGNSWLYRSDGKLGKDAQSIAVLEPQEIDGRPYHIVSLFGRSLPLRVTANGAVLVYDRDTKIESTLLAFEGNEPFATSIDPCVRAGRVVSTAEKWSGPFGESSNVLHMAFEPSCADAGLTDAWFLPYVGMVRYAVTTIAGPKVYDLVAANSGAAEWTTPLAGTRLLLDTDSYPYDRSQPAVLNARLSVRSTSDKPLVLNFTSGQRFDLAVKNEKGETVLVWSADKNFIQVLGKETLAPGAERTWTITQPLINVPPGKYTAEAWLVTSGTPPKAYSASVAFEVVE